MGHEIVWTLAQREELRRVIELQCAAHDPEQRERSIEFIANKFVEDVSLWPLEWPTSTELDSVETWKWGGVSVRYRRDPSAQAVEILDISEKL